MSTHIPQPIRVSIDTTGKEFNTTSFQLIQWKHALKLEARGLTMSRGKKVSTHLRKLTGLGRKASIDDLYLVVCDCLMKFEEQVHAQEASS